MRVRILRILFETELCSRLGDIEVLIREAYFACDQMGCGIERATEIAERQERQHRAFGRRLGQSLRGRATVTDCARLFAVKGFLAPKRARSYTDRADFVAGYSAASLAERANVRTYRSLCRKYRARVAAIDYCALT